MRLLNRIIRGSVFRVGSLLLQIVLTFIMMPYIVNSLGIRMYGFWALACAFVGYFGLMDIGLASAVVRYVSRALGANDKQDVNRVASTAFFTFSGLGMAALLATLILAFLSNWFFKSPDESKIFGQVILITGSGFALSFPMRVYAGLLNARMRQDLQSLTSMLRLLIANALIYLSLSNGYGIMALAFSYLAADIFMHILTAVMAYRIYPGLQIRPSLMSKDSLKTLFSYGGISFWAKLAGIFQFRTPPILIAIYLNANYVTLFHVGARLLQIYSALIDSVASMGGPMYSWQEARGDKQALQNSFLHFIRISSLFAVFIGASIVFFGKDFVTVWMGKGYVTSYYIILILGAPTIIAATQGPAVNLLFSISRHRFMAVINTVETAAGLLLSMILLPYYGIYGVAAALGVSTLLCKSVILAYYTCKCIEVPGKDYVRAFAMPNLKLLTAMGIYFYLISDYMEPTYTSIMGLAGVQMLLFIPVIYFFVLEKEDRIALAGVLKARKMGDDPFSSAHPADINKDSSCQ
ncbi:Membrane protein involved in the export of O-antigen and teichoic acid [Desulfatibacillum alkenivorans DSM 16219]|uniref:Membrane protein involved in the export of O-antigen and teichoic acid n=1 Tax=Desulfatibacillum alkenivorans DSM 16219 TaxID=1121393 RepID=A0A1M6Y032_9BACT|nr:Membrane protein involved in the export of O-antigen and teichoic acid [Desulfatibacillum alkenivorans DSM 16219]